MEQDNLARTYLRKCRARRKALDVLFSEESHADVVRETQELYELALKAVLRTVGIDPPHVHDVGKILVENRQLLPQGMQAGLDPIARSSFHLRRDRELSFYGAEDVDPWVDYTRQDAERALAMADELLAWVRLLDGD